MMRITVSPRPVLDHAYPDRFRACYANHKPSPAAFRAAAQSGQASPRQADHGDFRGKVAFRCGARSEWGRFFRSIGFFFVRSDIMMEQTDRMPIPVWVWPFVVACVAIPVLALGGAIPGAIGGGGAFGCVSVARDPEKSLQVRVGICAAITVGCWFLFIVVLGGLAVLQSRFAS
jgi:hypothetical protein